MGFFFYQVAVFSPHFTSPHSYLFPHKNLLPGMPGGARAGHETNSVPPGSLCLVSLVTSLRVPPGERVGSGDETSV